MKFQIGDKVIIHHSNEEGEIVEIGVEQGCTAKARQNTEAPAIPSRRIPQNGHVALVQDPSLQPR